MVVLAAGGPGPCPLDVDAALELAVARARSTAMCVSGFSHISRSSAYYFAQKTAQDGEFPGAGPTGRRALAASVD